jgi:hypothetical protein
LIPTRYWRGIQARDNPVGSRSRVTEVALP